MRKWPLVALFPLLAVIGCQSSVGPRDAEQASDHESMSVPGRVGIDDDRDFDDRNPIVESVLYPFEQVGSVFDRLFEIPIRAVQYANGDTPGKAALMLEDKSSADHRRDGIYRLTEYPFTRRPPYTTAYKSLARLDDDPTVRASALRACNISRDRTATPLFVQGLKDASNLVRLEAAKGLANLPDPNAVAPLIAVINNPDENRDVRIAATDAIKYYRTPEVGRTLASLLTDSDFSVAWQARRSLVYLTHKDFGYDQAAWLGYFAGPNKPLG